MTRATGRDRRGFSMLIAITCIALVGAALALIGRVVTEDALRTGRELDDVQQRQLLLASHRITEAHLNAGDLAAGTFGTPAFLGATLSVDTIDRPSIDRVVATIRATFGRSTLRERATFQRAAAGWRLTRAVIER